MATRKIKLTGIAEWARVFETNRDMDGFDGVYRDHDGACTIDIIMDDANLSTLKASRSMKKGTPDARAGPKRCESETSSKEPAPRSGSSTGKKPGRISPPKWGTVRHAIPTNAAGAKSTNERIFS